MNPVASEPYFLKPPTRLGVILLALFMSLGFYLHNERAVSRKVYNEIVESHPTDDFSHRFNQHVKTEAFKTQILDIVKSLLESLLLAALYSLLTDYPLQVCLVFGAAVSLVSFPISLYVSRKWQTPQSRST